MKQAIRNSLKGFLKGAMGVGIGRKALDFAAMARRSYLHGQMRERLVQKVFATPRVLNGPFKGMQFPDQDWPKLLGSYEDELHGVIETICAQGYEQIIDIGAAEGYYAAGLALRNPQARIVAYELDDRLRQTCEEMVRLNNVAGRVEVKAKCELQDLAALDYARKTLIFCDVDSYELQLLKPDQVPGLKRADLLVETHDFLLPGITTAMKERFLPTHELAIYREERSDHTKYPQLRGLTPFEQDICLFEDRYVDLPYADEWFHLTAKAKR